MRWKAALKSFLILKLLLIGRGECGVDSCEYYEKVEGTNDPRVLGHDDHVPERSLLHLEQCLLSKALSLWVLTVAATTREPGFSP